VSTDDAEIADIATAAGAHVPWLRSSILSDDATPTLPVVRDCLTKLGLEGDETVMCVYPTTPLLEPADLREAIALLGSASHKVTFAAKRLNDPIYRAFSQDTSGAMKMLHPQYASTRTQDLPAAYVDAGQFYIAKAGDWLELDSILGPHAGFVELSSDRAIDIDSDEDLRNAIRVKTNMLAVQEKPR
jgi:N-acylneuraminate cytidylyltransferase